MLNRPAIVTEVEDGAVITGVLPASIVTVSKCAAAFYATGFDSVPAETALVCTAMVVSEEGSLELIAAS